MSKEACGSLTVGKFLSLLDDLIWAHENSPYAHQLSQKIHWELEYLDQGKRYPSPHKQKSKVWRDRMKKKLRML